MIKGLNHITIAVSDLARSMRFYTEILGIKGEAIWDNGAYLSADSLWLCLSCDPSVPFTASNDYSHIAFDIEAEQFQDFYQHVMESDIKQWKDNKSEGQSVNFVDPDGHKLEVHCGSLASRLASLKNKSYKGLKWL